MPVFLLQCLLTLFRMLHKNPIYDTVGYFWTPEDQVGKKTQLREENSTETCMGNKTHQPVGQENKTQHEFSAQAPPQIINGLSLSNIHDDGQ